jgi:hypothetical protein
MILSRLRCISGEDIVVRMPHLIVILLGEIVTGSGIDPSLRYLGFVLDFSLISNI